MQKAKPNKFIVISLTVIAFALSYSAQAQNIGPNAFSPYTMYGLGELQQGGSAEYVSMGGIGVAVRESYSFNYANPASLSAIPQRSAIMNFGGQLKNIYSRTNTSKTSYNSANLHDFGFAFPLARGVGLGVALLPYSSIGYYNVVTKHSDPILDNIGQAVYTYDGDGGVSQLQAGLGVKITRGLSLGVNMHYYFGSMNRYYNAVIYPMLGGSNYRSVSSTDVSYVSAITGEIGAQYQFRVGKESSLTIGATYQTAARTQVEANRLQTIQSNLSLDTVSFFQGKESLIIPEKFSVGVHYQSEKLGFGVDYIQQDWRDSFTVKPGSPESLSVYREVRAGISYTPNRIDIRSFLKRWTYKAGVRYGTSYMNFGGQQINDCAVTVGLDIPLRRGSISKVTVGAEVGSRGTTRNNMVQETYFRVVAGLTLFGDDMWFTRVKFD